MTEPDNLVLQLLRAMRGQMTDMRSETRAEFAEIRSEMKTLRADVASDMMTLEKRLSEQIGGLRRAVME